MSKANYIFSICGTQLNSIQFVLLLVSQRKRLRRHFEPAQDALLNSPKRVTLDYVRAYIIEFPTHFLVC